VLCAIVFLTFSYAYSQEFETDIDPVSVNEGGTGSFLVRLTADPGGSVSVTVSVFSGDTDITVTGGSSLNFDSGNYNIYQPVTLSAAEDDDADEGSATILIHDVASLIPDKNVTANEVENDLLEFETLPAAVTVPEGGTETFQVKLSADPLSPVSVLVSKVAGGDDDISVNDGADLTFTSSDWDTYQTVTLGAIEDDDAVEGTAVIRVSDVGAVLPDKDVDATEGENDTLEFDTDFDSVSVPEGGTTFFQVRLTADPLGDVDVSVFVVAGGDADITIDSGSSLTFNSSNWGTYQTVDLGAAVDADAVEGTATIRIQDIAAVLPDKDVLATESENDTLDFEINIDTVNVPENSTADFLVRLMADPLGTVNVTVARNSGDTDISVTGGNFLTFDSTNYFTYQSVTLTALEDGDAFNGSAIIQISDNGGIITSKNVTATEIDNDGLSFDVSPTSLSVAEGSTNTFDVRLTADPLGTVNVSVGNVGGDPDITVTSGATLVFNSGTWNSYQTVTLTAAEDVDAASNASTIRVSDNAAVITFVDVTATEIDNDSLLFDTNTDTVFVPEGSGATFQVRLTADPVGTVNATVAWVAGDTDITITGESALSFNSLNWNDYQTVTLAAAEDADAINGSATIRVSDNAAIIANKDVTATEQENDSLNFLTDLDDVTVPEGSTAPFQVRLTADPLGTVNVSVNRVTGDSDLTVQSGGSLSFNSSNWNSYQIVTLEAAEDSDAANGTANFRIRDTGGVITDRFVAASEQENDSLEFQTNTDALDVPEGSTANFEVRLTADPLGTVNVTVSRISGDTDISVQSGSDLTFNSGNWNSYQGVTLVAAEDDDVLQSTATIRVRDDATVLPDKTVTATEQENDTLEFQTNTDNVDVPEEGTADFQVRLTADPSGTVNVTVSHISGDPEISVQSGGSLAFTSANWSTYQTVTLAAAADEDVQNGTATIGIRATDIPNKDVTATEQDNGTLEFQTSINTVNIDEGGTNTFNVRLTANPLAVVNVTVSRSSGDSDITVQSGASLTFNGLNWDEYQIVTLAAAEDEDAQNGTANIRIHDNASVITNKNVTANEVENESLNFQTDTSSVTVPEQSTAIFRVRLTADPLATVNVTVSRVSGDTDITVQSGGSLVFNSSNWSSYRDVELAAADDVDILDGTATIRVSDNASVIPNRNVTATEQDDDELNFVTNTDTLAVPEGGTASFFVHLAAQPPGNINVTISRVSGDTDITVQSGASLVFTGTNWDQDQEVVLEAVNDVDIVDGAATIRVSDNASVIPNRNVTATEQDDDALNFVTNTDEVIVPEGETASFFVKLEAQPPADVNVTVSRASGDSDITILSGASLVFTSSNWDEDQEVVLEAAPDPDINDGIATFRLSATDVPDKDITATEQDDAMLNGEVRLVLSSLEGAFGSRFVTQVEIFNNKQQISTFEFDFHFDDTMFVYSNSSPGTLTSDWSILTGTQTSPGHIRVQGVVGAGTPISASSLGSVIQIHLQVRCLTYPVETESDLQADGFIQDFIDYVPDPCITTFTYMPCTILGDVDGNGNVTPGDAQMAFEIFLGRIDPDICQEMTSDANCSDVTTPGDSQQIFEHFLGRRVLPTCCAEASPLLTTATRYLERPGLEDERERRQRDYVPPTRLLYPLKLVGLSEEIVSVPVILTNPFGVRSFGFELGYPYELLEYLGTKHSTLTANFDYLEGVELAEGLVRVEGESEMSLQSIEAGSLAVLMFKVKKGADMSLPIIILNAYGDIANAVPVDGSFTRLSEERMVTRFLNLGNPRQMSDGTVRVPVKVNTAFLLKAFGLVVQYSTDGLTFVGVERGESTEDFVMLDGAEVKAGKLKVGGFGMSEILELKPTTLFYLVFNVHGSGGDVEIVRLMDDLIHYVIQNGRTYVQ